MRLLQSVSVPQNFLCEIVLSKCEGQLSLIQSTSIEQSNQIRRAEYHADQSIATDDAGNRNNILSVSTSETKEPEPQNEPDEASADTQIPVPTLVVEKTDNEPSHGDDFGVDATTGQKDAHEMRSEDAEADSVVIRPESRDSETAAEVADVAATLDRPTTPEQSTDEEAGRTGERRMSMTPIPQVSDTAAEVADIAAVLDKEEDTPEVSDNEAGVTGLRRRSITPIGDVAATASEVADSASQLENENEEDEPIRHKHIVSYENDCMRDDIALGSTMYYMYLLTGTRISAQYLNLLVPPHQQARGLLYLHMKT